MSDNRQSFLSIKKYFPLIGELVKRDLKVKYRRSFLGYLWSLLNPLMMMTVMYVVFSNIFRYQIEHFPLYLICGQTLFSFFNESTNFAMNSIIVNAPLIKKVYIPKIIFPISRTLSSFVTTSLSILAILIVIPITKTPFTPYILLAIFPLLMLFIFSCGIGMVLSALSVYFRDILHLYSVLTLAWMYITPIFYPIGAIAEWMQKIIRLNPLYYYITIFRNALIYGNASEPLDWLIAFLTCIIAFLIGIWTFSKTQKNFILYI